MEVAPEMRIKVSLISGNEVELSLSGDATMSELRTRIEKSFVTTWGTSVPAELQKILRNSEEVVAPYDVPIKDALGEVVGEEMALMLVAAETFEEVVLEDFSQQLPSRLVKEKVVRKGHSMTAFRFRDRFTGKRVMVSFHQNVQIPNRDGQPLQSLVKDVFMMKHLKHPNLVSLLDVPPISDPHFCMITEWMDTDLGNVIRSKQELTEDHCRYFIYQILEALCYLHSAGVVYCNLTPHKVLLKANCDLKIKQLEDVRQMGFCQGNGNEIIGFMAGHPWYQAPETFLSCSEDQEPITGACDLWSAGCLFFEMYARKVLFNGSTAMAQLKEISKALGSPEDASWFRGRSKQLLLNHLPTGPTGPTASSLPWTAERLSSRASAEGCQLLQQMILWDPGGRCSARAALQHACFDEIRDPEDEQVDTCLTPIDWEHLATLEADQAVNFLRDQGPR